MSHSARLTIAILTALAFASCGSRSRPADDDSTNNNVIEISDLTASSRAKADSALALMTLEQKAGQCFMPSIMTDDNPETIRKMQEYINNLDIGGILLLKGDLKSAAQLSSMSMDSDIPVLVAIDAEWGLGMRLEDAPGFPRNGNLPKEIAEDLLYDYGREVARECRRVGIGMVLGPVVDVAENPDGVIGTRSFGSDPHKVADLGVAYAMGLESGGVISVAKHFPGHGSPDSDSHKTLPKINRDMEQLDSIDLYPFRHYIASGLSGIMVGHLAVPAIDPEERPAAVSAPVIDGLLRNEMNFHGLVLTDALNMAGAKGFGAVDALRAGADIIIGPADTQGEIDAVIQAVRTGDLPQEIVDDRCRRILFHKYLLGFDTGKKIPLQNLRDDVGRNAKSVRDKLERNELSVTDQDSFPLSK